MSLQAGLGVSASCRPLLTLGELLDDLQGEEAADETFMAGMALLQSDTIGGSVAGQATEQTLAQRRGSSTIAHSLDKFEKLHSRYQDALTSFSSALQENKSAAKPVLQVALVVSASNQMLVRAQQRRLQLLEDVRRLKVVTLQGQDKVAHLQQQHLS
eukprot:TRINITY_DN1507_c0_g1_i2.p1 TRINITY_DN1507_c0_g1~~TRINITY_DN1507_c0_g1_i2.p1  ORF type:complete len:157 (-),score=44.18 TRINITY_DN1507_c0_g1_i2:234-704(-)